MRFAANISTLLQDVAKLSERFELIAKRTDFTFEAIECQNPYSITTATWAKINETVINGEGQQLKFVLINSPPLFEVFKEIPSKDEFKTQILDKTLEYAIALKVPKVHLVMHEAKNEIERSKIVELLQFGARFLAPHNIVPVIEPLSTKPNYYLQSYDYAKEICEKEPNLKVMLDLYHLQRLHGNLTHYFELLKPIVGHVQISQVPLRDSPNTEGEIDFNYALKKVAIFYEDYVGLEYFGKSDESFEWLEKYECL